MTEQPTIIRTGKCIHTLFFLTLKHMQVPVEATVFDVSKKNAAVITSAKSR